MTKEIESITIRLLSSGYRIEWQDKTTGFLSLNWGLRERDDEAPVGNEEGDKYIFFFKWRLELETVDGEKQDYLEEVTLPVLRYVNRDSFQLPLAEALMRIFVRSGVGTPDFAAFIMRHYDVFFTRLDGKMRDLKFNISLVTDVFEQVLMIGASDLEKVKGVQFTYPDKAERKGGSK